MEKKMICFDVDGTLQDTVYHQVCEKTKQALYQLKENGYYIVIATGRGLDSLTRTGVMEIIDWDGYVCNNGQVVLNREKKEIFHACIPPKLVEETLVLAKKLNYAVVLKSNPRIITKEPDNYVKQSQIYFQNVIPPVGKYTGQDVSAMIVYGPLNYDYAPFFAIEGLTVLPGESTYADLTVAGISKATGIQKLMKLYDCQEYVAFGDSLNDMEMFKEASLSIAMGQGNDLLKQNASYITTPIDEDGIYKACLHFHFITERG